MAKKESVEDILRKHDLEEAELILRKQLDQEEKEETEMPKPPRPPAKRKTTKWASAKLGRNQQIILQLLREKKDKLKNTLLLEFTTTLYPAGVSLENRKKAKMLFNQALRPLKHRNLIEITHTIKGKENVPIEAKIALSEPARDPFYRKPAILRNRAVLENLVLEIVNKKIAAKQKTITTEEVLHELATRGINGPHVNSQKIGRILGKYLFRVHTEKGSVYHLFSVPIPLNRKTKKTKKNWKSHPQYIETGMGIIRVK